MGSPEALPSALVVSGDDRIARLLAKEDTVVIPAYACRLDGFVNDTFTEYANASVFRPASVCRAKLVSHLQDVVRVSGPHYLGFTMYTSVRSHEPVEMWIGHRRVARACAEAGDNRLHLFVAPERFRFRGGEGIRLVTGATEGTYRIENIVLLRRHPRPLEHRLKALHPSVDLAREGDRVRAHVTWVSNRPADGYVLWGQDEGAREKVTVSRPAVG